MKIKVGTVLQGNSYKERWVLLSKDEKTVSWMLLDTFMDIKKGYIEKYSIISFNEEKLMGSFTIVEQLNERTLQVLYKEKD